MISPKQIPTLAALTGASVITTLSFISCASNSEAPSREVSATKTHRTGVIPKAIGVIQKFIPPGNLNRRTGQKMKPRYITIHSTANQAPTADAEAHVRLLHRAGLGRLSWHYNG